MKKSIKIILITPIIAFAISSCTHFSKSESLIPKYNLPQNCKFTNNQTFCRINTTFNKMNTDVIKSISDLNYKLISKKNIKGIAVYDFITTNDTTGQISLRKLGNSYTKLIMYFGMTGDKNYHGYMLKTILANVNGISTEEILKNDFLAPYTNYKYINGQGVAYIHQDINNTIDFIKTVLNDNNYKNITITKNNKIITAQVTSDGMIKINLDTKSDNVTKINVKFGAFGYEPLTKDFMINLNQKLSK